MTDAPAPAAPVSPASSVLLGAAALVAAGLVTLGVSGLVPRPDVGPVSSRSSDQGLAPVPAEAAPAPQVAAVGPSVAFEQPGAVLSPGTLGPWEEVVGDWSAVGGQARLVTAERQPALAVVAAPPGTTIVQVTLAEPRSGAGVVTSYRGPTDHVAFVVDPSGRAVVLQRIDGDARQPLLLGQALLQAPGEPLVLAVRRVGHRVQGIANGVVVVDRVDRDRPGADRVGLAAGPGRSGLDARFDDLVVA